MRHHEDFASPAGKKFTCFVVDDQNGIVFDDVFGDGPEEWPFFAGPVENHDVLIGVYAEPCGIARYNCGGQCRPLGLFEARVRPYSIIVYYFL